MPCCISAGQTQSCVLLLGPVQYGVHLYSSCSQMFLNRPEKLLQTMNLSTLQLKKQGLSCVQPYSRLQSGVGQGISSTARQRRTPATHSPHHSRGASPASSFASVVSRNTGNTPGPHCSAVTTPVFQAQARQLARSQPWADDAVLQACPRQQPFRRACLSPTAGSVAN